MPSRPAAPRLYASDFHDARIDVLDAGFAPVALPAGAFTDPALRSGFAPFNIQEISGPAGIPGSFRRLREAPSDRAG